MEERWKPCAEFPLYEISTCGNIRHSRLKKLRKFRIWRGYKSVQLRDEANRLRTVTVHRLMAKTFLRGLEHHLVVDHINGARLDNRLENLRIVTLSGNRKNRGPNGMATFSRETIIHIIDQHNKGKTVEKILASLR